MAFAMRWDQLFPLAIFKDLCKISDTAKQGGDRRVHEGESYPLVLILVRILNQVAPDFGIPINPLIQNWGYYQFETFMQLTPKNCQTSLNMCAFA